MVENPTRVVLVCTALVILPVSLGIVGVFLVDTQLAFYTMLLASLLATCWCWIAVPYMFARVVAFIKQREVPPLVYDWWQMELVLRVICPVSLGLFSFAATLLYAANDYRLPPFLGWLSALSLISEIALIGSGGLCLLGAVSWVGIHLGLAQNTRR